MEVVATTEGSVRGGGEDGKGGEEVEQGQVIPCSTAKEERGTRGR